MASLAIKGHSTRGSEVIALLEMLGGKNPHKYTADCESLYFYIDGGTNNIYYDWANNPKESSKCLFTLEEFLEKFPYKVGDKVITDDGDKASIVGIVWDSDIDDVFYDTQICNEIFKYPKELLQPNKEETMEEKDKAMAPNLVGEDYSGKRFGYKIPQGYEFDCIQNNQIIIKPIKPQYPKTYVECCKVVNASPHVTLVYDLSDGQKYSYDVDNIELYNNFRRLKICRDAYYKIAGEQMGLEKPWEPDWEDNCQKKWLIDFYHGGINFISGTNIQFYLAFPTAEMRNAFYENFKELIEICKELL